jgi:hypothetical protein
VFDINSNEAGDDAKDRFYKELEQVYDHLIYRMKIMLENFNAKLRIEDTFKPTTGNESLRENSSDKGIKSGQLFHIKKKHS